MERVIQYNFCAKITRHYGTLFAGPQIISIMVIFAFIANDTDTLINYS